MSIFKLKLATILKIQFTLRRAIGLTVDGDWIRDMAQKAYKDIDINKRSIQLMSRDVEYTLNESKQLKNVVMQQKSTIDNLELRIRRLESHLKIAP